MRSDARSDSLQVADNAIESTLTQCTESEESDLLLLYAVKGQIEQVRIEIFKSFKKFLQRRPSKDLILLIHSLNCLFKILSMQRTKCLQSNK